MLDVVILVRILYVVELIAVRKEINVGDIRVIDIL